MNKDPTIDSPAKDPLVPQVVDHPWIVLKVSLASWLGLTLVTLFMVAWALSVIVWRLVTSPMRLFLSLKQRD